MTHSRRDFLRRLAAAGLVAGMAETERRYWWLGRWAEPTPDHRAFAAIEPGPEPEYLMTGWFDVKPRMDGRLFSGVGGNFPEGSVVRLETSDGVRLLTVPGRGYDYAEARLAVPIPGPIRVVIQADSYENSPVIESISYLKHL